MSEVGQAQRENAVPEVSFYTGEFTITANTATTINHGLPRAPRQVWLEVKNKVAEFQYNPGDIAIPMGTGNNGLAITYNGSTITFGFTTTMPHVLDTVTDNPDIDFSVITADNWNLVIKAEV